MNATVKGFISGTLAGSIATATAVVTALQETPLAEISDGAWVSAGLGGFLAAAAGWRTLLADSGK